MTDVLLSLIAAVLIFRMVDEEDRRDPGGGVVGMALLFLVTLILCAIGAAVIYGLTFGIFHLMTWLASLVTLGN